MRSIVCIMVCRPLNLQLRSMRVETPRSLGARTSSSALSAKRENCERGDVIRPKRLCVLRDDADEDVRAPNTKQSCREVFVEDGRERKQTCVTPSSSKRSTAHFEY